MAWWISTGEQKAALNGISADEVARSTEMATAGFEAGLPHDDAAKEDIPIMLRLDRADRSDIASIGNAREVIDGRQEYLPHGESGVRDSQVEAGDRKDSDSGW